MTFLRRDKGLVVLAVFLVPAAGCLFLAGCGDKAADCYNRGCYYSAEGQYDLAISEFTKAIEIDPEFVEAYLDRGNAYSDIGKYDQAIADFTKTVEILPEFTEGYVNRGLCYAKKGDYDRAIADFNKTITLFPESARGYVNRGCVYHDKGEYDKAISDCTKALEMYPEYAEGYINRGSTYAAILEYDLAVSDFTRALEINPDFVEARHGRMMAYKANGEYGRAIADCSQLIKSDPGAAGIYNSLAWLLATCPDEEYRDGRKAVENAIRACELRGWANASYLDTLAAAYAEAGEFEQAVKWQTKALEQAAPGDDRAAMQSRLELYKAGRPYRNDPGSRSPWSPVPVNTIGVGVLPPAP